MLALAAIRKRLNGVVLMKNVPPQAKYSGENFQIFAKYPKIWLEIHPNTKYLADLK